jgi:hypothetical protein
LDIVESNVPIGGTQAEHADARAGALRAYTTCGLCADDPEHPDRVA